MAYLEALFFCLGFGLLFIETHHRDLGVREAGGRDVVVVHHVWMTQNVLNSRDTLFRSS